MKLKNTILSTLLTLSLAAAIGTASARGSGSITLTTDFGSTEVIAWSWGAFNSGSFHVGGGGGAGKANFQDVSITRYSDALSANFLSVVANGNHIANATLTRDNLTIELQDVLVTSYSVGGTSDKKELTTENISLNFARVKYEIDGSSLCWDVAANAPASCN